MNDWFYYLKYGNVPYDKFLMVMGAAFGFMFGGWNEFMKILLVLQGVDIITGLFVGVKNKSLNSTVMRDGLFKKIGVWMAIVLAHMIDIILFDGQGISQTGVLFAFIAQEGLSILENLGNIGVIVPDALASYLEKVRDKAEKEK